MEVEQLEKMMHGLLREYFIGKFAAADYNEALKKYNIERDSVANEKSSLSQLTVLQHLYEVLNKCNKNYQDSLEQLRKRKIDLVKELQFVKEVPFNLKALYRSSPGSGEVYAEYLVTVRQKVNDTFGEYALDEKFQISFKMIEPSAGSEFTI